MNVGLVFAGGFAKGAYQIGVLQAFKELLPANFFSCISTSSVGTLNAYAYLIDILKIAEEFWSSLDFSGLLTFAQKFYKPNGPAEKILEEIKKRKNTFNIDFYTTLLSYSPFTLNYMNLKNISTEKIPDFIQASFSAFPFAKSVLINEKHYLNGAIIDNIPVFPFINKDLDFIIVVYFDNSDYFFESPEFNKKIIRINFLESNTIQDSFKFDKESVQNMIKDGKEKAEQIIKEYNLQNINSLQYIYDLNMQKFNQGLEKKEKRISGDVLMDNFNKISSKLLKKHIIQESERNEKRIFVN